MAVRVSEVKAPASLLPFDLALYFHILLPKPTLPGLHIALLNRKGDMRRSFTIVRWQHTPRHVHGLARRPVLEQ